MYRTYNKFLKLTYKLDNLQPEWSPFEQLEWFDSIYSLVVLFVA